MHVLSLVPDCPKPSQTAVVAATEVVAGNVKIPAVPVRLYSGGPGEISVYRETVSGRETVVGGFLSGPWYDRLSPDGPGGETVGTLYWFPVSVLVHTSHHCFRWPWCVTE